MMRPLTLFIIFLGIMACQQTRQMERSGGNEDDAAGREYILDSLLNFFGESDLIEKYGKENILRDTNFYQEDADRYVMTLLYPKTRKEVEITWNDTITFSSVHAVYIDHPASVWRTSEGITIGMPLAELVEMNKKEVEFSGLGWDFGGRVSWMDGALQNRGIYVIVDAPEEEYDSRSVLDSIFGDKMVSSRSASARKAKLVVTQVKLIREHE